MKWFVMVWIAAACLLPSCVYGQNMVPNPGFENIGTAPCSWITSAAGFSAAVNNWTMPSNGSTDIFSNYVSTACYAHVQSTHASRPGRQLPHNGNAMSALVTYGAGCGWQPDYREYLQVQLTAPMVSGQAYDVEFYISLGDAAANATNNFGAHFRNNSYFQSTCFVLSPNPQFNHTAVVTDNTGWTRISGTVTATSNWRYVILGNFFSNAATATSPGPGAGGNTRYFIDDVGVSVAAPLPAAELAFDGQRSNDGSVELSWEFWGSENPTEYRLQRSQDGLNWEDIAHPKGGELAHEDLFPPRGELQYRLRYKNAIGTQFTSETIAISPGDFPYDVTIAPNPAAQGASIKLRVAHGDQTPAVLEVFDLQGRQLLSETGYSVQELDGFELTNSVSNAGIYFARIYANGGNWSRRFIVQ